MKDHSNNTKKGRIAETYAAAYLRRQNYTLLSRNYSFAGGELDIIAETPEGETVFTEVKSVWNTKKGSASYRVSRRKQIKIWKTACHFLHFHGGENKRCRFDVIALDLNNINFKLTHFKNAFDGPQTFHECQYAF
ncbi:MAG TPA: YraN family protein [Fibrobacteraceae bacterium]|jgi:putative endonuclease|nr:YraN family protein [Fibrobacter sp.]HOG68313.1 YraN family protein [Fibrobacteraceae bacterium]HPW95175.1 YraN family protein [Fibrobacteraceae bacterium]